MLARRMRTGTLVQSRTFYDTSSSVRSLDYPHQRCDHLLQCERSRDTPHVNRQRSLTLTGARPAPSGQPDHKRADKHGHPHRTACDQADGRSASSCAKRFIVAERLRAANAGRPPPSFAHLYDPELVRRLTPIVVLDSSEDAEPVEAETQAQAGLRQTGEARNGGGA